MKVYTKEFILQIMMLWIITMGTSGISIFIAFYSPGFWKLLAIIPFIPLVIAGILLVKLKK